VERWHEYKKVAGVLLATIPLDTRGSLYARWGDVFAASCGGLVLLSVVLGWIGKRRGGVS
jgi:hypothetical protein